MKVRMSRRLAAVAVAAAVVACAGTLLGASDRAFKITAPADGATVQGSVTVHLLAKGFGDIAYVIFGVDQVRPHSSNSLPYRYVLNTQALGNGAHTLSAWGFSKYGMVASANPVTIMVANPSAPKPAVTAEPKPAGPGPMLFAPPVAPPAMAPSEPQGGEPSQLAESSAAAPEGEVASPAEAAAPAAPAQEPEPAVAAIPATVETSAAEATPAAGAAAVASTAAACLAAAKADSPRAVMIVTERPDHLTITVDGNAVGSEVEPEMRCGVAYGALRSIVERIGGRIGWQHLSKQATAETDGVRMVLVIGQSAAQVNDEQVSLAGPVWLKEGRTMAPVRSCAEALSMGVAWQPTMMTVALVSPAQAQRIGMAMK